MGSDRERDLGRELARRPFVRSLAGQIDLVELAALLSIASTVVAPDSGPLHLAAALGTKVVGLYGPTNWRRLQPFGIGHRVVLPVRLAQSLV